VAACEKSISHLHSFMLIRHGQVVAEGWWHPWRAETPQMLFSLSKSFTASAVGLAIHEGRLSLDDPVLSFFAGEAPKKVSPNLGAMQVRHLLSMSTGHDQDTTERVMRARNPFKAFLALPVEHTPGTHFVYNSGASFMLAAIVQKLTNQTLVEYLEPRLFEPLGILDPSWESHHSGVNFGGWGLSLKTEDIAGFGQLYLQKGLWNGQQLLPEAWVAAATAKQVSNGDDPNSDWSQGYGFQFWRCRHNCYRGDGAFGQYCVVMPDQDAVLAITGGVPDMQAVLNLVWETLLPAMGVDILPHDGTAAGELERALQNLSLDPPQGAMTSPLAARITGKTYKFEKNYETLDSLRFNFGAEAGQLTYRLLGGGLRRGTHRLAFGNGTWLEGIAYLGGPIPRQVTASGAWTAEDTFVLSLCAYETPFIATITCRFEGEQVRYDFETNLSFGPADRPQLVGISG
jgi:CubicO group peptidase (beta-lactamase class C family)